MQNNQVFFFLRFVWNYDYDAGWMCQVWINTYKYSVFVCSHSLHSIPYFFCCCLVLVVSRLLNLFMRINGDYHFDCRIKRCTQFATEHSIVSFFCACFFFAKWEKKSETEAIKKMKSCAHNEREKKVIQIPTEHVYKYLKFSHILLFRFFCAPLFSAVVGEEQKKMLVIILM